MLIAHLTDAHIGLDPGPLRGRVDPVAALRHALAHVRALPTLPEVLLLSGDLTESGRDTDYQTLHRLFDEELPGHRQGRPRVLAVAGNHDRPLGARRWLSDWMPAPQDAPPGLACVQAAQGGLHFIGLDTVVPGQPHGALGDAQLEWLAGALRSLAGLPVVIFMHHPPIVTGMAAMDSFGLRHGRCELARLIAGHGQVQLVASGHMHRPILGALGGAPVVVAPSTSHQMALDLRPEAPLAVRLEPPMIGLYRWSTDDGMACHFSHVQAFDGPYPI
jgi:3',5'-cyclic AMP phosphodiesterase CpdA